MFSATQLAAIDLLITEELRAQCCDPRWARHLEQEMEALHPQQRIAVTLFFLGLTFRQIAVLLAITPCEARQLSSANEEVSAVLRRLAEHV